jgi:hypothetical protein
MMIMPITELAALKVRFAPEAVDHEFWVGEIQNAPSL